MSSVVGAPLAGLSTTVDDGMATEVFVRSVPHRLELVEGMFSTCDLAFCHDFGAVASKFARCRPILAS